MPYGVENLTTEQLEQLIAMYTEKIPRLLWQLYEILYVKAYDMLSPKEKDTLNTIIDGVKTELATDLFPIFDPDYLIFLQNKIERLRAKKKAVEDELAKRTLTSGGGSESPHHTDYFIDFLYGDDANDGLTPATAWKTIPQYTTNTVRSPGDVAYVRRGQTHLYNTLNIVFDEDGQPNNPIVLMADDGTGWPDETGLAKPIISFGDAAYQFVKAGDNYWKIKEFEIRESTDVYGMVQDNNSYGGVYEDCKIHDKGVTGGYAGGMFFWDGKTCTFINCKFEDNYINSVRLFGKVGGIFKFINCIFDGGAINGTSIGLQISWGSPRVELIDCDFGVTVEHTTADILLGVGQVYGRNVNLASTTKVTGILNGSKLSIEDLGGTKLNNKTWLFTGEITRDTAVVRVGGATSSARMEPNSNCGLLQPLELCAFTEELSRWLTAGTHSVSIYIYGEGWTIFPTADELYVEVLYYDGVTAKRAVAKSTAVLTENLAWTEFDVPFTLNSDSPCYANVILKKYEAGAKIYVDILPVWS